jgi:hypothetical protein
MSVDIQVLFYNMIWTSIKLSYSPPSAMKKWPSNERGSLFFSFGLNIFYLLKCAKKIRHKLNKLMKSSPIYNKLQH